MLADIHIQSCKICVLNMAAAPCHPCKAMQLRLAMLLSVFTPTQTAVQLWCMLVVDLSHLLQLFTLPCLHRVLHALSVS